MLAVLLFALGCTAEPADTSVASPGDELLQFGRIQGTVTRSAPLAGDGLGVLMVCMFSNDGWGGGSMPYRGWADLNAVFTADDSAVEYELYNIFPQDEPFYMAAFFDDDLTVMTGDMWAVTDEDLASVADLAEMHQITVGSGEEVVLDLVLEHTAALSE